MVWISRKKRGDGRKVNTGYVLVAFNTGYVLAAFRVDCNQSVGLRIDFHPSTPFFTTPRPPSYNPFPFFLSPSLHDNRIATLSPPAQLIRIPRRIQIHNRVILLSGASLAVGDVCRQIVARGAGDVEVGDAGSAGVIEARVATLVSVAEADGVRVEGCLVARGVIVVLDGRDANVGDVGCAGAGEGGAGGYDGCLGLWGKKGRRLAKRGKWKGERGCTIVGPLDVMVVVGLGPSRQEHPLETREAG